VKNLLYLILALVAVLIVWGIIKMVVFAVLGLAVKIAMVGLFCFLVYFVYKLLSGGNRERIM